MFLSFFFIRRSMRSHYICSYREIWGDLIGLPQQIALSFEIRFKSITILPYSNKNRRKEESNFRLVSFRFFSYAEGMKLQIICVQMFWTLNESDGSTPRGQSKLLIVNVTFIEHRHAMRSTHGNMIIAQSDQFGEIFFWPRILVPLSIPMKFIQIIVFSCGFQFTIFVHRRFKSAKRWIRVSKCWIQCSKRPRAAVRHKNM